MVDRLLASPHYGERWGRHWLDVVRFAETNGYERDGAKPSAWRYRDYVIDALNRDKPYNRFLTEQLAGDEVEGSDAPAQIATTFLRLGTWDDEPAEPKVDRYDQLDDVLGTAATAFLGITLRCARCHDHKFEPFSQADYYRMLAVFEPLKRPQNDRRRPRPPRRHGSRAGCLSGQLARPTPRISRQPGQRIEGLIKPEIDRLLSPPEKSSDGKAHAQTDLAAHHWPSKPSARRPGVARRPSARSLRHSGGSSPSRLVRSHCREVAAALRPLDDRLAAIDAAYREPPRAYIWYEESGSAPITHVLKRGDPDQPGAVARSPGVPAVLAPKQPEQPRPTAQSTGRRLWLARWLTSHENPLVARVIVNRIWQFHFGRGLVASSNDLGVMGEPPTHPELLDWLASELMAGGWRLKPLHRLIVLSQAYQQSVGLSDRSRHGSTPKICSGVGASGASRPRSFATRSSRSAAG